MKKSKRKIMIIVMLVIGLLLLVISTITFAYRIPELDNRIDKYAFELDNLDKAHILQDMHSTLSQIAVQNHYIFQKISNDTYLEKEFQNVVKRSYLDELFYLTIVHEGEPNLELLERAKDMNAQQIIEEINKFEGFPSYIDEVFGDYVELQNEKRGMLYYSVIFQIFGLVIIQSAVILSELGKKY